MSAYSSAPSRASQPAVTKRMRDESGVSIVIALVFFLICAIIGSVVLTAASVNAKAVQTHRVQQQAEFAVSSAAQTIAQELESAQLKPAGTEKPTFVEGSVPLSFASAFWDANGKEIMAKRAAQESFETDVSIEPTEAAQTAYGIKPAYGKLTVDRDLNIKILLSADASLSADSPYNLLVTLQCIPTFNAKGELTEFAYEQAVIRKAGGAS